MRLYSAHGKEAQEADAEAGDLVVRIRVRDGDRRIERVQDSAAVEDGFDIEDAVADDRWRRCGRADPEIRILPVVESGRFAVFHVVRIAERREHLRIERLRLRIVADRDARARDHTCFHELYRTDLRQMPPCYHQRPERPAPFI